MFYTETKVNLNYYIDLHLIHEVTSPQAFEGLRIQNRKLRRPDLTFATLDHNVPTIDIFNIKDEIANKQITTYRKMLKILGYTSLIWDLMSRYCSYGWTGNWIDTTR